MTSIISVTTDTHVPVVRAASDASTARHESDAAAQDAGFAGWRSELAAHPRVASGPTRPRPSSGTAQPSSPWVPAPPSAPTAAVVDRFSAPALSANAAIASQQARQRTYQTLAAVARAWDTADVGATDQDGEDRHTLVLNLRLTLLAHRAREVAAVRDTVTSANLLARDIAGIQAGLRQTSEASRTVTETFARRDALVRAWVRLTGGAVVPADDTRVDLALGGTVVLNAAGPRELSLLQRPDGSGRIAVGVTDADRSAAALPVTSGVIGGQLEVVNEVIPQVLAALAGSDSADPSLAVAGLGGPGAGLERRTPYLRAEADGADPVGGDVLIHGHLGVTSAESVRASAASVTALQHVNAAVLALGSAAEAAASAGASPQLMVQVSRPDLVSAAIDEAADPAPGGIGVTVLSAARPGNAVSEFAFSPEQVLNGGLPFTIGVVVGAGEALRTTTVTVGEYPTVKDVAAAINSSGAGVRASTAQIATGTVQLVVTSLVTGRTAQVTITDGQQPPATSTILGRFRTLEGTDTVVAVDRGGLDTEVVTSSSTRLADVLPGVLLTVAEADPASPVSVVVDRAVAGRARQVESMVQAAGSVLETVFRATSAGAAAAGDQMLDGIAGRVVAALTGPAGRALPGFSFGRPAMSFDRDHFEQALRDNPAGTETVVTAVATSLGEISREVSQPREGYLALRLQAEHTAATDYRAPRAGAEDVLSRHHETLEQRSRALASLLGRLGDQGSWLGTALPSAG